MKEFAETAVPLGGRGVHDTVMFCQLVNEMAGDLPRHSTFMTSIRSLLVNETAADWSEP